jgi:transcription elongation factor GreA
MSDRFPMTPAGNARMKAELKKLKDVDRPANSKAIETARAHGDLKENADYHAAKEEQGMIEARIRELDAKTSLAEIIEPTSLSGDRVMFGATVTFQDTESSERKTYTIVGDDEGDLKKSRISLSSPIARAMIGKSIGDVAVVRSPKGNREVEIVSVEWLPVD